MGTVKVLNYLQQFATFPLVPFSPKKDSSCESFKWLKRSVFIFLTFSFQTLCRAMTLFSMKRMFMVLRVPCDPKLFALLWLFPQFLYIKLLIPASRGMPALTGDFEERWKRVNWAFLCYQRYVVLFSDHSETTVSIYSSRDCVLDRVKINNSANVNGKVKVFLRYEMHQALK